MTKQAMKEILHGHPGIGQTVCGEALVAHDNFSARYDLDRLKGRFSRPEHKLHGESYVAKILILNAAKGGVASAWMLKEMMSRNMGPKALVLNFANPIMAQGAAYADLRDQGVEFIAEPRDPDPSTGVESVVCCRDPDGYIIELIEYIGGRLGSRIDDLEQREG